MKTGNKAQAVILSVVAIGAIGFLVTRLIPSQPGSMQGRSGTDRGTGGRSASVEGLPTEIVRDAFSHPGYVKRLAMTSSPKSEVPSESVLEPVHLKGAIGEVLPSAGTDVTEMLLRASSKPVASKKPSGSTEIGQQEDKAPKSKFELKAIMSATKPIALISLDGTSEVLVRPGEQLTATYRVGKFSENAVQLISATESFWIYVGQGVEK